MKFKTYTTAKGETLLYTGMPNLERLDALLETPGDLWHSSLDQGFENCFEHLIYQTSVYWWFLNDFNGLDLAVNWRLNYHNFVIRETTWNSLNGFDDNFSNELVRGLDFGFNLIRHNGGIPIYVKGLYEANKINISISDEDRYLFFLKHFKRHHSYYMMYRQGLFNIFTEYKAFKKALKKVTKCNTTSITPRHLNAIQGQPTVSLVIPTMRRQEYTELLLNDHNKQSYLIKEAIIVDATPKEDRDPKFYNPNNFKFDIKVKWQTSKGSCRARNEAIAMCTGDYIIFADDDVRVLPDFVENHIRLLQTYNAQACNGLDIMAEHTTQDLTDLQQRLDVLGNQRFKVGVSHMFSNANSCVKRSLVKRLIGNDINFDGGYGEDTDFGFRILQHGEILLHNPFSPNLHLKPKKGGYRFWGHQSKIIGKKRKTQPWELDKPVKYYRPIPSPTMTYGFLKHYKAKQLKEWRRKHFFIYLFKGKASNFLIRLLKLPYKHLQFNKSIAYAKRLIKIGERYS
ncbi:glycosyltransferase family 2 protein [Ichthyenterobacterium magnum]|uniref:GT2 family glycosyltransferase n=1 Tax=Ichthyenterobacterium magnum TaxID=1230530 RepID=A0A420DUH2_9FLAO|nr:glycosyltransferase [Ichthyenterobacterium magnum]RKE97974.1 GT2 family glycosyltransferase [Ichthyenterobacterium magnum]